jgi:hypothetical protein
MRLTREAVMRRLVRSRRGASRPHHAGSRRVLCSIGFGPYEELLAISRVTFEAFAERHGYDVYVSRRLRARKLLEHVWAEDETWRSANTGVFLVRSTPWARRFLERVWESEQYIDHAWWENAAVLDLLGYELPPDLSPPRRAPGPLLDPHVELIGLEWNSTAGASLAPHPRIRHHGRAEIADLRRRLLEDLARFRRHLS